MRRPSHQIFMTVFGVVYLGLMTSFLVCLATLPLVAVLLGTDPAVSWPLLALLAPLAGPALSGAFAVFSAHALDGSATVARTFARAWRDRFGRSAAIAALASVTVTVLGVDAVLVWGQRIGAFVIPLVFTGIVLAVGVALMALVVGSEYPAARLRDVLKVALFTSIRRWYAIVVSLVVAAVLGALVSRAPAIALGVALAPLLYLVWATSRQAIVAVLRAAEPHPV